MLCKFAVPAIYYTTPFVQAGPVDLFSQAYTTSGWISTADNSRCTWQDNELCSTSFGRLRVLTVGCE